MPARHTPSAPNVSNKSTILRSDVHSVAHPFDRCPAENNLARPKTISPRAIDKSGIRFPPLGPVATVNIIRKIAKQTQPQQIQLLSGAR